MDVSRRFSWLFSSLFLISFFSLNGQGYRVEVIVDGLSGDTVILGEYFTTRMIPKDTMVLDHKGRGVFEGPEPFSGGLYIIYLSQEKYFDFLLGDDQQFSIRTEKADLAGSLSFIGSDDNTIFMDYKKTLEDRRVRQDSLREQLALAPTERDSLRIQDEIDAVNREMEAYMNRVEKEHAELFVSKFIGLTRIPIPPDELLNGERRHDDSIRFFYNREHYFDLFDPFDVRLLHTPVYEGKIMNYITRVVPQHPDSLIVAVDFLLEGSKVNSELYRYMMITLFNHFAESKFMGMDAVYFHIAEYYYIPDATWSSPDFISKLKDNLEKNKPTLIGQKAPNLIMRMIEPEHFQMAAQDTAIKNDPHIGRDFFIHDIKARYTILYFWEADCGHCKEATPALYEAYGRLKDKGVEVISVHVINSIEGKALWVDFINKYEMYDWINCWSPYSNDFRRLYNLQAYPMLFIFDKDKKIVAKRVTPEQAEQIINNLIAMEAQNNS
jgi:thiol-disulfide isomerase/thioredoxin